MNDQARQTSVRAGMRPLELPELRQRQLAILGAVAEHCDRHELRYYLCAGTLLGAVRHRGYIPWDDDIDIMLPRPDYKRFCKTFSGGTGFASLSLRSLDTSPDYPLPFAKVCDDGTYLEVESDIVRGIGVYIDVFPVDGWCRNDLARWVQRRSLRMLALVMRTKHLQVGRARRAWKNAVLTAAKTLAKPIKARRVATLLTRVSQWSRFTDSDEVGVIVWGYREAVPRVAYGAPRALVFEGSEFAGPNDSDCVLSRIYGDYMTPPPTSEQVTNHRFTAFARAPQE